MSRPIPETSIAAAIESERGTKRSVRDLLIASDIKMLVFVGRCMDFFGMGAVLGFLFGGSFVYGYALFEPLPYSRLFNPTATAQAGPQSPPPQAPPKEDKIKIHGIVTTDGTNVVRDAFQVGVVEIVSGEFTNGDGTFHLEVPRQSTYKLAFWKPNYENLRVLEVSLEEGGLLSKATWLPRNIALNVSSGEGPKKASFAEREKKGRTLNAFLDVDGVIGSPGIFREPSGTSSTDE